MQVHVVFYNIKNRQISCAEGSDPEPEMIPDLCRVMAIAKILSVNKVFLLYCKYPKNIVQIRTGRSSYYPVYTVQFSTIH